MAEEAIQKDVSEVEETETQVHQLSRREQAMEALIARRQAESAVQVEEPTEEAIEETDQDEKPAEPEVPMIELIGADGSIIRVPASAKYKAKIDGQEVEVPFDKMTRNYQVGVAADSRMDQASKRQKELEQKERDLDSRGQELSKKEQAYKESMQALESKKDEGTLSDDVYRDTAKKLLKALTDSEDPEAEIATVLKGITPQPKTVNTDEILTEAEKRAQKIYEQQERAKVEKSERERAAAIEKERTDANTRFAADYKDVIEDPIAYSAAKDLARQKWSEAPNAKPWDIAKAVGDEIRSWKEKIAPKETKKKPPATPRVASGRAVVGKDEEQETRETIIKDMRRSRGQPV